VAERIPQPLRKYLSATWIREFQGQLHVARHSSLPSRPRFPPLTAPTLREDAARLSSLGETKTVPYSREIAHMSTANGQAVSSGPPAARQSLLPGSIGDTRTPPRSPPAVFSPAIRATVPSMRRKMTALASGVSPGRRIHASASSRWRCSSRDGSVLRAEVGTGGGAASPARISVAGLPRPLAGLSATGPAAGPLPRGGAGKPPG
jgi:hypothetical protein